MAAPLQDMFDFVKKSLVATKYDIDVNSSGGDTLCFVKKLPYVEDRYEAFRTAESVQRVALSSSVKANMSKACQPHSETSPLTKKRGKR